MTLKNKLQIYKEQLFSELTSLSDAMETYVKVFPDDVVKGLPNFKPCEEKCKNAFLQFSTCLSTSLDSSDDIAAKVSSLMISADNENDNELILLCADTLSAYESYKLSACRFLDEGYKIFNQKNEVSVSTLFRINQFLTSAIITFKVHLEKVE